MENPEKISKAFVTTTPPVRLIYVREGPIQSVLADIFSYGMLVGVMFLNVLYWGGHWYTTIFLLLLWFFTVIGKAKSNLKEFHSIDEAIKALESERK